MEVAKPPFPPILSNSKHQRNSLYSSVISMSQDYHQHRSFFGFSNGFEKSAASATHHQEQQIRRDNGGLVGVEEEEPGGLHVYETAGMLSELFNFHPVTTAAAELLEPQMIMANSRQPNLQPPSTGLTTDWYGERSIQLGDSKTHSIITHNHHNPITAINADPVAAMQLFLMNPQPRSSSSTHPPPSTSSTLHILQGFAASDAPTEATSGQFSWLPDGTHGGTARSSSHGLSLSLSSSLQQLEASKADDFRMGDTGNLLYYNHGGGGSGSGPTQQVHFGFGSSLSIVNVLRNSKYARATQELLEEFCSVGRGQFKKSKLGRNNSDVSSNPAISGAGGSSSSSKDLPPLSASDRIEHQRRKVKLLSMLDEVDRRYSQYCEQMQMMVNSFDLVMGFGAAAPYTMLAQKAMSRHFRCLKDGITVQLKHSCDLLGEKDGGRGSGITKGETPRLKMLEQSLRQQRAFHQIGMIEQEAWRPQRGLPERSVNILRSWLFEHFLHPYPSDADKHQLARQTGLSRNQVSNWFINARVRLWKPMVEDMYQQEAKDADEDGEDHEEEEEEEEVGKEREEIMKKNNGVTQTTMPTTKRSHINASENDPSINTQPFSENQASQPITTALAGPVEQPCFPATIDLHDTYRLRSIVAADYGTSSANAEVVGPTLVRYGTTAGDVSLTLGLRHAGNMPDKSAPFSITDFGGC